MDKYNSGVYIDQGSYKSFIPTPINRVWRIDDMDLLSLLSKADRALGRLDMFSEHIPNIDLFIAMHKLKEATQSSRIEGTQTNIEEALLPEEDVPLDKRDDWAEIQNYISAMNMATRQLDSLPFSSRLIREIHKELMKGVRGAYKQPGEFRLSQNWIGGSSIQDAVFVPPPFASIPELMSDIEMFIHNPKTNMPDLLKIAIIHYQFETIHPFNDGNGRVGRLMITLYLVSKGLLKRPILYLSDYLEKHRNSYYSAITNVREKGDMVGWLSFFLNGVIETSEKGVKTFERILSLEKEYNEIVRSMGKRSANAMKLLEYLYQNPSVDAKKTAEICSITQQSSYNLIDDLVKRGLLVELTGAKRGRRFLLFNYFKVYSD